MDTTTSRELRERIAHYRFLLRMTVDERTLGALTQLIAETEEHLRQLSGAEHCVAPLKPPQIAH